MHDDGREFEVDLNRTGVAGVDRVMDDAEEFCRRHWLGLARSLTSYVGDAGVGQDLAQDALACVVARWRRVSRMRSPAGYAYRVGVNLAKDELARRARDGHHSLRQSAHQDEDPATRLAVTEAVRALPDRQRLAVTLRYLADLSVAQTAQVMGCRPGTVKSLCSHATQTLRVSPDLAWHASSPVNPDRRQQTKEARTDG